MHPTLANCDEVHRAAAQARERIAEAREKLSGLGDALKSGSDLDEDQSATKAAFEDHFGKGSATSKNIERASKMLGKISDRIGAEGEGAKVKFGGQSASGYLATGGNGKITLYDGFFGPLFGGVDRANVILHEGGHLAGLYDLPLPSTAPAEIGRTTTFNGRTGSWAYGRRAAAWLGENDPGAARKNNDNYNCFADPSHCGQ